jgi:hypothetical protein
MSFQSRCFLGLSAALLYLASCTKPTAFGEGLLSSEVADYAYTDTLTLRCTVEREDSLLSSDRNSISPYFLCGQLQDPFFGVSTSEIYSLLQLSNASPNFTNATLDSAVLYLRFSPAGFYGDTTVPQTLRVHQLDEQLRWDRDYFSNQSLLSGPEIGKLENFLPRPSTLYNGFDTAATAAKAAYIAVPLSADFGNFLLDVDSLDMTSDSLFWKKLRGIRISAEPASSPGAMMAFNLNEVNFSFIRLYYKRDTLNLIFDYEFLGCNKFTHFTHDYSGSSAGQAIGQAATDYLYLQGMGGLRLKVEIPYADQLGDVVINKAELVLATAGLSGDNPLLKPANQLVFTELQGDSALVLSSDVLHSIGPSLSGSFDTFGGYPIQEKDDAGAPIQRYRMTLNQRFQDMVEDTSGDVKNKTIYINIYPQRIVAARSVLFGPNHPDHPIQLQLKYTRL